MQTLDGLSGAAASLFAQAWDVTRELVIAGVETAPALVFGLAVIAVLPFLIVGGVLVRGLAPAGGETARTARFRGAVGAGAHVAPGGISEVQIAPAFSEAVIVVESDGENGADNCRESLQRFRFDSALVVRVGREEDNEIRLHHPTVHRYHALIRRSYEDGYEIADLSDETGNGIFVNGEKVAFSRLGDGDLISLGAARLRFEIKS